MRLIERLFKYGSQPYLGMDPDKKPPEMSMYLSVLRAGRLHRETKQGWRVVQPVLGDDPENFLPVLHHIMLILEKDTDRRVKIADLFAELRLPPFGVRDGLHPLLLAVFAVVHDRELAFYENEGFLRHVGGEEFLRIVKVPESFEIQLCRISGIRSVLFDKLSAILDLGVPDDKQSDILHVVRPLCVFAAQLPTYVLKTRRLSDHAISIH